MYIKLPKEDIDTPYHIKDNPKLMPFFKDVIGALDGTHIHAAVPSEDRACFRNCKGGVSQNVLAACDFDFKFTYVLSGWEGSAADSAVWEDARTSDFRIPEGKLYLGDAGFPSSKYLLVPYRGVCYHLHEWGIVEQRYVSFLSVYECFG